MSAPTVPVGTTKADRHCPPWCVVPAEEHAADASGWDGGASHWSRSYGSGIGGMRLACVTEADGSKSSECRTAILTDAGLELNAEQARATAEDLLALAALIDGTEPAAARQ